MASTAPLVVGVDRSDESAAALTWALRWATALGRPLTVVHAVGLLEEGGYRAGPAVDEQVAAAHRAVPGSDSAEIDVVREDGPAVDVLLRVAARLGADTIVVGRRGLGEAPRPLGSVSEALLGRSPVPVLVVPAA
jgi:nucleotide-binding universal stress UspA family protein